MASCPSCGKGLPGASQLCPYQAAPLVDQGRAQQLGHDRRGTRASRSGIWDDHLDVWRIDPEGVEPRALAELAPVGGLRVLELGCGDGRLTFRLAPAARSIVAVDPDQARLAKARAALPAALVSKVELVVAGATEVHAPRPEFDLALFSWSL